MIPCGGAKVNRITGFFRAWRGVFAGACPSAPCVVGLRSGARRGGVLSLSPTNPAFSLLSFPPSPKGKDIPQPALAERSSPPGKGEIFSFLMQGASPLASPGLNGARHWFDPAVPVSGGWRAPALPGVESVSGAQGVAYFLCRLLTLPLACLFAPYPPDPLPRRGRGRLLVFLCKGLRPLHPRG